jgi:hypothetical protein
VGGPSAGYALALNTLSALLRIPLCIDFGITGAPWTKGVRKDEVGGSVIIGGHNDMREALIGKRITYKKEKYYAENHTPDLKEDIIQTKKWMRQRAEREILRRVNAIHRYLQDENREKYISHEQIFNQYMEG